ncbi:MAG: transglutaminase family protein [Blastochloris sp.]|nr:transglutaminase family protein [Blastochloris sp.]
MMIYEVYHKTEYRYSEPVTISNHVVHLEPRGLAQQRVEQSRVEILPRPTAQRSCVDYFGNHMMFFTIEEPHVRLQLTARSRVEVWPGLMPAPGQTPPWEEVRAQLAADSSGEGLKVAEFLYDSPLIGFLPEIQDYAKASFTPGRALVEAALELNHRIRTDFVFDPTATTVSTPLAEVFLARKGVCQDFAHLMVGALRSLGLAARYVSGYVRTQPAPGAARIFGADASHAWVSLYCPGYGWVDMDPTNDRLAVQDYVTLGWGRDYGDVSLIRGILSGGGQHSLYYAVNVEPVMV